VSDWFWVSRERSENLAGWTFSPFSVANGSLVVPSGSALHNLNDIRGRRIGVVGTSHDQAWSVLRRAARRSGWDILKHAHPEFGPPPVIASRFEKGDFDAALLIWSWAALLEARGKSRQILSGGDLLRSFGFTTDLPLLGYVFSGRWATANEAAINGFFRAAAAGEERLASSEQDWLGLMPLTGARNRAELKQVRDAFRSGIPKTWAQAANRTRRSCFIG
jgi:NitT/TauT family transport system substrate-binding protein